MTELIVRERDVIERQATHLIGTLGHVSEGKSTLIRALTGIKTQRHQKEQERNITIHLGYANCKVFQDEVTGELTTNPSPSSSLVAHLSFVDCPGHEAFLATMMGGASIMDTACLIIAANQEVIPQPQTLEHLMAAHLMGLERLVVVQNKLDLLTATEATDNYAKIKTFVADTNAEHSPVYPTSAQHGWGVSNVLEYLTGLPTPERRLNAPAQLTCVRSFDVNKPGPFIVGKTELKGGIIGGTLQQGVLVVGDWIELRPGVLSRGRCGDIVARPILTRVCGLRCETTELPYAIPGSLIAIATDLDPGLAIANGMVGQRVGVPGTLPPIVGELVVRFRAMKRDEFAFSKQKVGDQVKVCSNVMTVTGVIIETDKKVRRIRLDRPLCLAVGEMVGVLRMNTGAGRELLEGAGEVREVVEWTDIVHPVDSTANANAAVGRVIRWEPMTPTEFNHPHLSYTDLLERVMARKEEKAGAGVKFKLKEPVTERFKKHIIWVNWPTIVQLLDTGVFDVTHAQNLDEYLQKELLTTTSVNGQGQLVMKGIWKLEDLRSILRKYVAAYKRCKQCDGYETGLVKAGKVLKVRCIRCNADNVID